MKASCTVLWTVMQPDEGQENGTDTVTLKLLCVAECFYDVAVLFCIAFLI